MKHVLQALYAAVVAIVSMGPAPSALAQSYPAKPVKIIVNYPPGGPTDVTARQVGLKMQEYTGQPFLVENMASASGTIGTQAMLRAPADGYTFMLSTVGHTSIAKALYEARLPFDPFRDLAPIANLVNSNQVIVVHPDLGVKSIAELIKLAKSKPGQISYGSVGVGSPNHLGVELLKSMTGIDMLHVPYKGGAQVLADLLAGRVSLIFNGVAGMLPQVQSGKLIALASGSTVRSPQLPDVPTMEELGHKGYLVYTWYAYFAPAKAPPAAVARLNALSKQALSDAAVAATLTKYGVEPAWSTPEFLGKQMLDEYERWKKVVAEAKIVVD